MPLQAYFTFQAGLTSFGQAMFFSKCSFFKTTMLPLWFWALYLFKINNETHENVWNMFKVSNKHTKMMNRLITFFRCFHSWIWISKRQLDYSSKGEVLMYFKDYSHEFNLCFRQWSDFWGLGIDNESVERAIEITISSSLKYELSWWLIRYREFNYTRQHKLR